MNSLIITREGKDYLVVQNVETPLYKKTKNFDVLLPKGTKPLIYRTATTGMIEAIGNVGEGDTAVGYAFHEPHYVFRAVNNPFDLKIGERVYITEHLKIEGKIEYIVTKHKISKGQNNFLNIGYIKNDERITKLTIDVITGEHKWI